MEVTSVSFKYNRKFNLGNWESVEIEASQWARVEAGEDPDEVVSVIAGQCKAHVKANIPPGYSRQGTPPVVQETHKVAGLEVN